MIDFIECEEIIRYYNRRNNDAFALSDSNQYIVDKKTGMNVCSVEDYRKLTENLLNARFDVFIGIDEAHDLVFRCKKCGTIIWGGCDHRLDPHLNCPHCAKYNTNLPFWTKEEIDTDYDKQLDIASVMEHAEYCEFCHNRYRDTGLHDWELWKKENESFLISFTVHSVYYTKCKNLTLHICKKTEDWRHRKEIVIPLTFAGLYNKWIYPFTKKGREENKLPF